MSAGVPEGLNAAIEMVRAAGFRVFLPKDAPVDGREVGVGTEEPFLTQAQVYRRFPGISPKTLRVRLISPAAPRYEKEERGGRLTGVRMNPQLERWLARPVQEKNHAGGVA